jgi:hypothetical protein
MRRVADGCPGKPVEEVGAYECVGEAEGHGEVVGECCTSKACEKKCGISSMHSGKREDLAKVEWMGRELRFSQVSLERVVGGREMKRTTCEGVAMYTLSDERQSS